VTRTGPAVPRDVREAGASPDRLRARVPDTVFLPDRARLAINCLLGCLNPDKDHLPYCLTDLTGSPPRMAHTQFDYSDHTARVIDALLLSRAMTGSNEGERELAALEAQFVARFGDDGLHYTPDNPWSFRHANMHYQRSVLNGLLSLALVRGSEPARERIGALVRALAEISIQREGYAYFPAVERLPDGWPRGDWAILGFGTDPANTNGRLLFGLARAWELTGAREARALAEAYARHVIDHSSAYLPDGGFATGMEFREGHFHSRAVTMLGVIRLGHATGDARLVEWGRKVFDKARGYGTAFGWFPERLVESRAHGCETCAVVDMMEASIWLARSGWPQYWQVAERFLRNHLLESQLMSADGLEVCTDEVADSEWETTRDVARRAVGGFAGWSQPSDLFSKVMHRWDLYTCCSAQGVRGLFNAWTHAVDARDGELAVNLLINHVGADAVVRSWLPHEGRVEVVPAHACDVSLRLPGWVPPSTLAVTVDGATRTPSLLTGGYAWVADVAAGATVEWRFPVACTTTAETVLGTRYEAAWRGDTVMSLTPPGMRLPLYQRTGGAVAMREVVVPRIGFRL